MRASRLILAVATIILVGATIGKPPLAEDRSPGGPPKGRPQLSDQEGPFGGPPPPKKRGRKGGTKCKTAVGICEIKPPQPVDSPCSCRGPGGASIQGKVEE
jgi:hypothetical protein